MPRIVRPNGGAARRCGGVDIVAFTISVRGAFMAHDPFHAPLY